MNDPTPAWPLWLNLVPVLHVGATLCMTGLIWFVQVVHYPLFALVGCDGFATYEKRHQTRTTIVVAPLMLVEMASGVVLLFVRPVWMPTAVPIVGLVLLAIIWLSTAFWQVPLHESLSRSFEARVHRRLVRSNWLRTVAWTSRSLLLLSLLA